MQKATIVPIIIGIMMIFIGLYLAITGYNEYQKWREIWWNSADPNESHDAFNKMGESMQKQFIGIAILFFGIFITFAGGASVEMYFKNNKKKRTDIRDEHLNYNVITSAETKNNTKVSEQLYHCPYCGEQIPSSIIQEVLDGKSIQCKYCNSNVTLELIN